MIGQLGNGPLVNKPTWKPTIRDNVSIGNVLTWIKFYWKPCLGLNHLGIRGLPIPCIIPTKDRPDYLATIDVDPDSQTCGKVKSSCYKLWWWHDSWTRKYENTSIILHKNGMTLYSSFQVISRLHFSYLGDEIHHTGWNSCSSCYNDPSKSRNRLIVLGLMSSRIYIVDVATDPRNPTIDTVRWDPINMFWGGGYVNCACNNYNFSLGHWTRGTVQGGL